MVRPRRSVKTEEKIDKRRDLLFPNRLFREMKTTVIHRPNLCTRCSQSRSGFWARLQEAMCNREGIS